MWRFTVANIAGTSHDRNGLPCQDRLACALVSTGLVIAIADGAGSASHSGIGAEIATHTALKSIINSLDTTAISWAEIIATAANAARSAVIEKAAELELKARDFACTLLLVVAAENGGAALQIGDGVITYKDIDGWAPVFWPQKGEFANTTYFLTDNAAETHFEIAELPGHLLDLAVMTDGLERLALHFATRSVHAPFLEGLFKPLRIAEGSGEVKNISKALTELLSSSQITDRTDDDLTICLATRV